MTPADQVRADLVELLEAGRGREPEAGRGGTPLAGDAGSLNILCQVLRMSYAMSLKCNCNTIQLHVGAKKLLLKVLGEKLLENRLIGE